MGSRRRVSTAALNEMGRLLSHNLFPSFALDRRNRRTSGRSELKVVLILNDALFRLYRIDAFISLTIISASVNMQVIETWMEQPLHWPENII